ncbi:hypothetical protein GGI23_006079, partial [Coemansia sp. RSA 2559]
ALQQDREKERKRRVAEQRAAVLESADSYVRQPWEIVDESDDLEEYLSEYASDGFDESVGHSAAAPDVSADDADILDPDNDLSCFICDKMFKSAAQKENHEQSKKHRKAAREIRREMLREERRTAKADGTGETVNDVVNGEPDTELEPNTCLATSDGVDSSDDDEDAVLAQMLSALNASQPSKDDKTKNECQSHQTGLECPQSEHQSSPDTVNENGLQRKPKKELRRERQKNKAQNETICNVCNKEFSSRNQLFNHIKDTGHALANNLPKQLAEQIIQDRSTKDKKRGRKR